MKIFTIIALVLCLSACETTKKFANNMMGGVDNTEQPAELTEIATRLDVIKLWSEKVGDGSDKKYLKLSPTLQGETVYIAENGGDLNALDANNGNILWEVDTDHPITGGPGVNESIVLVGTQEGEVLAFDATNGTSIWKARVSSEILSAPQLSDGIVVTRTIDGKIFGINAKTGKRLWVYDRTVPALTLRGTSAPIIDSGLVIAGFDGGRLATLELETGKLFWESRIAQGSGRSELDRMVDIDGEPIIDAGTIYVATFQGNIAAVDLETGRLQWIRDISSYAGLGINDDYIFITDDSSHVWALDRFSGTSVWKQDKLQARAVTAPSSIGDYVVVGDIEGYLHWIDAETGEFLARTQVTEAKIIAPPLVEAGILYAYSTDGSLAAYTYQGAARPKEEMITTEESGLFTNPSLENGQEEIVEDDFDNEEGEGIFLKDLFGVFGSDDEDTDQ